MGGVSDDVLPLARCVKFKAATQTVQSTFFLRVSSSDLVLFGIKRSVCTVGFRICDITFLNIGKCRLLRKKKSFVGSYCELA